jgi:hypothetical protein
VCAPGQQGWVGPLHGCLVFEDHIKQILCSIAEAFSGCSGGRQAAEALAQLVELLYKVDRHGLQTEKVVQRQYVPLGKPWITGSLQQRACAQLSARQAQRATRRRRFCAAPCPSQPPVACPVLCAGFPASMLQQHASQVAMKGRTAPDAAEGRGGAMRRRRHKPSTPAAAAAQAAGSLAG